MKLHHSLKLLSGRCALKLKHEQSLQQHGIKEIYKQLRLRMKNSGLETIEIHVTHSAGKYKYNFTGSAEQVVKAEKILAAWP